MCRLGEAAPNNLIHQEQRKTSIQGKYRGHIGKCLWHNYTCSHWTSNPVAIRSPHKVLLSTIWTGDADRATIVPAALIWIGHQHILPAKSIGSTYRDTLSLWKLCHMGKTSHSLTHSSKNWLKGIFYYNFRPWKLSNPNGLCYIPLANWLHPVKRNGTFGPTYRATIWLAELTHASSSNPRGQSHDLLVDPLDMALHVAQSTPSHNVKPAGSPWRMADAAVLRSNFGPVFTVGYERLGVGGGSFSNVSVEDRKSTWAKYIKRRPFTFSKTICSKVIQVNCCCTIACMCHSLCSSTGSSEKLNPLEILGRRLSPTFRK